MSLALPLIDAEELLRTIKCFRDDLNETPDTEEFPVYRVWLDLALGAFWRSEWWPELMLGEFRTYRQAWDSATTYGAPSATAAVERYHTRSNQYYQSLRAANTNNEPADADGVENSDWWAVCRTSYGGPDWATGTVFTVTDGAPMIVRNPSDNRYYQCHTAHTAGASFDSTKFGILTPFDRYVANEQSWETNEIGDVFDVKSDNPKVNPWGARSVKWDKSENGTQVFEALQKPFVQFRRPRPRLKGNLFDATLTYAVGDQIYWDNGGTIIGNFYDCVTATSAGEDPTDTAAKWAVVEIPQFFQGHLVMDGASKALMADDRDAAASVLAGMAEFAASLETDVLYRQQGLTPAQPTRSRASAFSR